MRLSATGDFLEVFCPTALSAGPIHSAAGFTGPLWSARRVWLPSRRIAPGPTWPALFHAGCAPGLGPSEVAHAGGGTAFLQLRTDGRLKTRPLVRASTAIRRIPPPLGLAPPVCPSPDDGELHRHRARASPGLFLSGVCPSSGLVSPSANLRPPAWPTCGHPPVSPAARRINHRPTISIRYSPPTEAGELTCLAAGADERNPYEVPAPFHDSETEGDGQRISLIFSRIGFFRSPGNEPKSCTRQCAICGLSSASDSRLGAPCSRPQDRKSTL